LISQERGPESREARSIHGFAGRAGWEASQSIDGARLDLDGHEDAPVEDDEVELAFAATEVAAEDLGPLTGVLELGASLAERAEGLREAKRGTEGVKSLTSAPAGRLHPPRTRRPLRCARHDVNARQDSGASRHRRDMTPPRQDGTLPAPGLRRATRSVLR
jgi:hypothetical protein